MLYDIASVANEVNSRDETFRIQGSGKQKSSNVLISLVKHFNVVTNTDRTNHNKSARFDNFMPFSERVASIFRFLFLD
jgi:hypothetical protein